MWRRLDSSNSSTGSNVSLAIAGTSGCTTKPLKPPKKRRIESDENNDPDENQIPTTLIETIEETAAEENDQQPPFVAATKVRVRTKATQTKPSLMVSRVVTNCTLEHTRRSLKKRNTVPPPPPLFHYQMLIDSNGDNFRWLTEKLFTRGRGLKPFPSNAVPPSDDGTGYFKSAVCPTSSVLPDKISTMWKQLYLFSEAVYAHILMNAEKGSLTFVILSLKYNPYDSRIRPTKCAKTVAAAEVAERMTERMKDSDFTDDDDFDNGIVNAIAADDDDFRSPPMCPIYGRKPRRSLHKDRKILHEFQTYIRADFRNCADAIHCKYERRSTYYKMSSDALNRPIISYWEIAKLSINACPELMRDDRMRKLVKYRRLLFDQRVVLVPAMQHITYIVRELTDLSKHVWVDVARVRLEKQENTTGRLSARIRRTKITEREFEVLDD